MMGTPATLKIDIIADASKAEKALTGIDDKLAGFGKAFKGAAIAGAVAAVGTQVFQLGKEMVAAAEEGRSLSAATEAIIKTTGGAANVSVGHVEDLANSLARTTGVSDDSIQAAQNLLLTFNKVTNATDDGTGAFDRATKAALDLAAAGFGSVETNATQLGKALQDPIKGMTALTRSGVSFTAQEQETIKALQESGDLFAAQEMILKAVEGQVQGTAEASATSSAKMAVAWEQAQETIGNALLPIVDELLPVFTELIDALVPAIMPVVKLIADLATTLIRTLLPALKPLFPVIEELAVALGQEVTRAVQALAPLLPRLTTALAQVLRAVIPMLPNLLAMSNAIIPMLPLFADLAVLILNLASRVLPLLTPILRLQVQAYQQMAAAIQPVINALSSLINWANRAVDALSRIKIPKIPGSIGGIRLPWGRSAASSIYGGAGTMATSGGRGASSTTIRVDVTGVGFDSILTGRAITRQLAAWGGRNGLTPVQWAAANGGMPR